MNGFSESSPERLMNDSGLLRLLRLLRLVGQLGESGTGRAGGPCLAPCPSYVAGSALKLSGDVRMKRRQGAGSASEAGHRNGTEMA